ncbi:hypothetical protein [Sulfurovum sp. TSL1]|uniref:hypothetical protein n=1 Tax=Sulfurovum sp. TSL1 TaxID=2826994 RepID=UPI001CC7DC8C|nr:hypothetical protein [Sulfurovum sp. TSL1]GIT98813.1 hypothetical protein TSL1_16340 [Sulfurovum sp. TSL1]
MEDVVTQNNNESVLKKVFDIKYLVFIVSISLLGTYTINTLFDNDLQRYILSGVLFVVFIASATLSSSSNTKKILVFFVSLIIYLVIAVGILFTGDKLMQKNRVLSDAIRQIMKMNDSLPMDINQYAQLIKVSQKNDHTIVQYIKSTTFSKQDFLDDYNNDLTLVSKGLLHQELINSCPQEATYKLLTEGLMIEQVYYDVNNELITQIVVDHEKCRPYYANKVKS